MKKIQVVDSHTGGEPTRIIIDGGPDLGSGPLSERVKKFASDFDDIRRAVVDEPRGNDVLIGGLMCESDDPECVAGVIFFDTAGFLGMCGHGTMGFVVTMQHLGKISPGSHLIETPVGRVAIDLKPGNQVTIQNIPSYRYQKDVLVEVPELGQVTGDVAWGGNWFFLSKSIESENGPAIVPQETDRLLQVTKQIRRELHRQGITGPAGEMVDHIELYGDPVDPANHSKNFVLCPGGEYDRSPCGTGTSAKLACLAADGVLAEGETWRQESIIGSVFECHYQNTNDQKIIPVISGWARVCGESTLLLDPDDPFCMGIPE